MYSVTCDNFVVSYSHYL